MKKWYKIELVLKEAEKMAGKNIEERLADLEKRKKQIEIQQKQLQSKVNEQERKDRTRRLIQIGAKMEILGMKTLEQGDAFVDVIKNDEKARSWFEKIINVGEKIEPQA